MLELANQDTPPRIRFEFPAGVHAGECYNADLAFCPNPICACGSLELSLFRDHEGESEALTPEFCFEVDIVEKSLHREAVQRGNPLFRAVGLAFGPNAHYYLITRSCLVLSL